MYGQEDVFHPTQYLMEAVMFQAVMRLDVSVPYHQKLDMVTSLITMAGLKGKVMHLA